MSAARRWQMVDREHPSLSLVRQCALLEESDRQYLATRYFGSRRM